MPNNNSYRDKYYRILHSGDFAVPLLPFGYGWLYDIVLYGRINLSMPLAQRCLYLFFCQLTHRGREKWPLFSRRHFQVHFLEWKCLNTDWNFTKDKNLNKYMNASVLVWMMWFKCFVWSPKVGLSIIMCRAYFQEARLCNRHRWKLSSMDSMDF